MRVLIAGASGALARGLAARLLERGHTLAGIDLRPWPERPAAIELFTVDLRKRAAEDVFRRFRPHAVVHLATITAFALSGEQRSRINLGSTRAVFQHALAWGVEQVIFVGRHTYYGAAADAPLYHKEDDPPLAVASFPELADLVAADLWASNALWRTPQLTTAILRLCYTLGPSGHGTLSSLLRGRLVPMLLGFDPLFQFLHESDAVEAITLALEGRLRGVFNVAGPPPLPLSAVVRGVHRRALHLPGPLLAPLLGRAGLPRLRLGALVHLKYPVVVDDSAFRARTGYQPRLDAAATLDAFRQAFPPP